MQFAKLLESVTALLLSFLAAVLPGRVYLRPLEQTGDGIRTGAYTFYYHTDAGAFSLSENGVTVFTDAVCTYDRNGKTVSSADYTDFSVRLSPTEEGNEIAVEMRGDGLWDLTQYFTFYANRDWFTTRVSLSSPQGAATNRIAPLVITDKKLQNYKYKWTNVLEVPFDNDGWTEFKVKGLGEPTVSYEVGTLFTPDEGGGLVLGSLEHDTWKTAVQTHGSGTRLSELCLYCGAADPRHGGEAHGTVTGASVSSPLMFVGVFNNWKNGLNEFARANTFIRPKRAQVGDTVPFGWNSWGSVQTALSYDIAVKTSDYIKEKLQPAWETAGAAVYVNLDSYLDNLSAEELKSFADRCRANGQKVGVYCSPFVMWWDDYGMSVNTVPGTNGAVTYQDIRLKKHDGTYYGNEMDGCMPLDVTHPAAKYHVQNCIDRLKAAGFDYIKLDFLVQATFEGNFYDKSIQTGMQAYNYAMSYLTDMIGDDVFINLAMSPLFPYQYANGRRLACDSFYGIGETEYTLNAVTYGFWEKELYDYTDPDHLVVWGKDAGASQAEARSRVTCGAISGTSFLAGDDFVSPAGNAGDAFERYEALLTNPDILFVARSGRIFTPVITSVKDRAAHIYKCEIKGKTYIAVFNFSKIIRCFTVDTGYSRYQAKELWRAKESEGSRYLTVLLQPKDAALYEITG